MSYGKGRRAEYKARDLLEADGFVVVRAAGSKGPADLIAWNADSLRVISVKSNCYLSTTERAALVALPRPGLTTVEYWRFIPRRAEPVVEVLA